MRPFGAWFGRLAMAGACLLGAGCGGGGDVPDPDSDSHAASADGPKRGPAPRAADPEPEAAPKAEAPALAGTLQPVPTEPPAAAPPLAKAEEKPAEPDNVAAAGTKADSSGTDDMLKMSSTPPTAATAPAAPALAATTPAAPGQPSNARGFPGAPGGPPPSAPGLTASPGLVAANANGQPVAADSAAPAAPNPNATGPAPIVPNRGRRGMEADPGGPGYPAAGPGAPGGPGSQIASGTPGAPGMPGAPGAPGASGFGTTQGPGGAGSNDPLLTGTAAFNRPATAVQAFLAALKAKDKERLSQTVALHAKAEAVEKHKKIFQAIEEKNISDDELDEMSKALEGYQVMSQLPAYSTGKIGILVSKVQGRDRFQRTITARKEKEGWKVLDIDSAVDFKSIQMNRGRRR